MRSVIKPKPKPKLHPTYMCLKWVGQAQAQVDPAYKFVPKPKPKPIFNLHVLKWSPPLIPLFQDQFSNSDPNLNL